MKQVGDRAGSWSASALAIAVALGVACEAEKVWTFPDAVADAPMAPPCEPRLLHDDLVATDWEVTDWIEGLAVVALDRSVGDPVPRMLFIHPWVFVQWETVMWQRVPYLARGRMMLADPNDTFHILVATDEGGLAQHMWLRRDGELAQLYRSTTSGILDLANNWTSQRTSQVGYLRATGQVTMGVASLSQGLITDGWPFSPGVPVHAHHVFHIREDYRIPGFAVAQTLAGPPRCRLLTTLPYEIIPYPITGVPDLDDCHGAFAVQSRAYGIAFITRDSAAADSTWTWRPLVWTSANDAVLGPPLALGQLGDADSVQIESLGGRMGVMFTRGGQPWLRQYRGDGMLLAEVALPTEATDVRLVMLGNLPTALWKVDRRLMAMSACTSPEQARERPPWPDGWRGGPDPALIRTAEQP